MKNLYNKNDEVFAIIRGKYDSENFFVVKGVVSDVINFPKLSYEIEIKEFKNISILNLKKISNCDNYFDGNFETLFKYHLRNSNSIDEFNEKIKIHTPIKHIIESPLIFKSITECNKKTNLLIEFFIFNHIRNLHQLSTNSVYKGFLSTKNSDDFINRFSRAFYDTTKYSENDFIKFLDDNL